MMDLTDKNGEFSWIIRTQLMSNIPSGVITAGWEIHTKLALEWENHWTKLTKWVILHHASFDYAKVSIPTENM